MTITSADVSSSLSNSKEIELETTSDLNDRISTVRNNEQRLNVDIEGVNLKQSTQANVKMKLKAKKEPQPSSIKHSPQIPFVKAISPQNMSILDYDRVINIIKPVYNQKILPNKRIKKANQPLPIF